MINIVFINELKCPNCKKLGLREISAIYPKLVKCNQCQAQFQEIYIRGYWQDRVDLSRDELARLVKAADYYAQANQSEQVEFKAIANKLAQRISVAES